MYYHTVPIQSQTTLDPNTIVGCTTNHSCGGNLVNSTIKDCCDHDIEPSGFAYTISGNDTCQLCPVGKIIVSVFYSRCSYLYFKCNSFDLKVDSCLGNHSIYS